MKRVCLKSVERYHVFKVFYIGNFISPRNPSEISLEPSERSLSCSDFFSSFNFGDLLIYWVGLLHFLNEHVYILILQVYEDIDFPLFVVGCLVGFELYISIWLLSYYYRSRYLQLLSPLIYPELLSCLHYTVATYRLYRRYIPYRYLTNFIIRLSTDLFIYIIIPSPSLESSLYRHRIRVVI